MAESLAELSKRVDAFMNNGGKEQLAAAVAAGKEAAAQVRRALTPDPNIMRMPMTI